MEVLRHQRDAVLYDSVDEQGLYDRVGGVGVPEKFFNGDRYPVRLEGLPGQWMTRGLKVFSTKSGAARKTPRPQVGAGGRKDGPQIIFGEHVGNGVVGQDGVEVIGQVRQQVSPAAAQLQYAAPSGAQPAAQGGAAVLRFLGVVLRQAYHGPQVGEFAVRAEVLLLRRHLAHHNLARRSDRPGTGYVRRWVQAGRAQHLVLYRPKGWDMLPTAYVPITRRA